MRERKRKKEQVINLSKKNRHTTSTQNHEKTCGRLRHEKEGCTRHYQLDPHAKGYLKDWFSLSTSYLLK